MEDNEYINKHLKNSLGAFLVQPRLSSFDQVLDKMKKKKRRRFLLFLFPGLFLFFTVLTAVYLNTSTSTTLAFLRSPKPDVTQSKDLVSVENKISAKLPTLNQPGTAGWPQGAKEPASMDEREPTQDHGNTHKKANIPPNAQATPDTAGAPSPQKNAAAELSALVDPADHEEPVTDTVNYLGPKRFIPTISLNEKELLLTAINESSPGLDLRDSAKKERSVHFLAGVYYTPQWGSFYFSENKKSYHSGTSFAGSYLKTKREQNEFRFFHCFGIKAGVTIKDKWEILAGFGLQKFTQDETLVTNPSPGPVPNGPTLSSANPGTTNKDPARAYNFDMKLNGNGTYTNIYRYRDYALEVSRFYKLGRAARIKGGVGLHARHMSARSNSPVISAESASSYGYGAPNWSVRKWLGTVAFRAGLIENLNKRIQFQACPVVFCSLNSMFVSSYVIRQRAYSAGLECSLLFRLR